jgi:hypothetical protein
LFIMGLHDLLELSASIKYTARQSRNAAGFSLDCGS